RNLRLHSLLDLALPAHHAGGVVELSLAAVGTGAVPDRLGGRGKLRRLDGRSGGERLNVIARRGVRALQARAQPLARPRGRARVLDFPPQQRADLAAELPDGDACLRDALRKPDGEPVRLAKRSDERLSERVAELRQGTAPVAERAVLVPSLMLVSVVSAT